jgi:hypothetical protein
MHGLRTNGDTLSKKVSNMKLAEKMLKIKTEPNIARKLGKMWEKKQTQGRTIILRVCKSRRDNSSS